MQASEYQKAASRTLIDVPDFDITDRQIMIVWCAVGVAGEAGEVVEHVKKGIFHQQGIDAGHIEKELGDLMWYVAGLCTTLGISLDDVMRGNVDKLLKRFPNGWNPDDSARKRDEHEN